jgi:branched-chain amino acid transport system substrate-binding protein
MNGIKMRRIGVLAAISALGLAACGQAEPAGERGTNTIRVGVSGSFTGATAFYGQEAKNGAELAIAQLNKENGQYKFEMVVADDECTPAGGASAYGSLIDVEKVDVILGSPCSGAVLAGMPLLPASKVPALAVSATNPAITAQAGTGGNPYIWRMNIGDDIMSRVFSEYIAGEGVKKVATIAVNNDYGRGGVSAFKASLPTQNVAVVAEQYYTQGAGEFRSQLNNIRASGAQAMLIVGAHQDAAVLIRQLKELALDIRVFARGDVVSKGFQDVAGDPALGNGIQEANNWDSTYAAYPEFAKEYLDKYDHDPQSYAVQAWMGVNVIAQAAKAAGGGREGIQKGLDTISWDSPLGPIKFDDHNQAHHDMFILGFVDGKIQLIKRVPTN